MNILLADDDFDDCAFFKEALEDLSFSANLSTVHNGVQLMNLLSEKSKNLPDVLFLDVNMPLKNGFECLSEIRSNPKLKGLPVIIFTTSFNLEVVDLFYQRGAHFYIRKPGDYGKLKKVISQALELIGDSKVQTNREKFILHF